MKRTHLMASAVILLLGGCGSSKSDRIADSGPPAISDSGANTKIDAIVAIADGGVGDNGGTNPDIDALPDSGLGSADTGVKLDGTVFVDAPVDAGTEDANTLGPDTKHDTGNAASDVAVDAAKPVYDGGSGDGAGGVYCPGAKDEGLEDPDGDLIPNACDDDDDGDGFEDTEDPEPLNPEVPVRAGTPEEILNIQAVKDALAALDKAGLDFSVETELVPPDITGFYLKPNRTGGFPLTATGASSGYITGIEQVIVVSDDLTVSSKSIAFESAPIAYSTSQGAILRGKGNRFTVYSRGRITCTEGNSSYRFYFVTLNSAGVDPASGDLIESKSLSVNVGVAGDVLSSTCRKRYPGDLTLNGGWNHSTYPRANKVTPGQFKFMCVSEQQAYVPGETWKISGGQICECGANYKLTCE